MSLTLPFDRASKLPFNSDASDETPRLSADDKTLYFATGRDDNGTLDIYKVSRPAAGSTAWGTPAPVTEVNTTTLSEKWFMPCGTDHYLMAQSEPGVQPDLVEGTLGGPAATVIDELRSPQNDTGVFVTPDCLTVYFASTRSGASRIYRSHRMSIKARWDDPGLVDDFVMTIGGNQEDPWLSPDTRMFVFVSDAAGAGNKDVYVSTRAPR
jgi:Tol biopolymer transport system component